MTGAKADSADAATKTPELPWLRINWQFKALLPIACVLLDGLLLFMLATLSWRDPERHMVLLCRRRRRRRHLRRAAVRPDVTGAAADGRTAGENGASG